MKKTILLIVTFIALAIAAFSQGSVYAKYAKYGEKNEQDSFVFKQDFIYAGITFTMRGDSITATDEGHSVYRIKCKHEIETEEDKQFQQYMCTDEQNRDCDFTILMYSTGEKYILLVYNDWAIVYKIE